MVARWCFALVGGVALLAMPALAQTADPTAPVIWFRSSEGCPDGAAFIARLRERAPEARIAGVNDRIDFVVTLGRNDTTSSGRLERQTAGSTVAIREIEAESCEEVADVLALTLTLALNPTADGTIPKAPPTDAPPIATQQAAPAAPPRASSESPLIATAAAPRVDGPGAQPITRTPRALWLLGVDLGALTGPTGALGPWLGVFAERRLNLTSLPGSSARLTALLSRVEDQEAELLFSTAAGRLEGCPVAVGSPALDVRPCLGLEVGFAMAEGLSTAGRDDSGGWLTANFLGRLAWNATPSLHLGFEAGASAPLIRYTFASESGGTSYQADPIGLFAAFGVALVLE